MEHLFLEDAKKKKHSTFTEAITVGKEVGAKFTVLTHFSQRYYKVPIFDEMEGHEAVGTAFDFMTVTPQTFGVMRHMYEPLKVIFADFLKEKAEKREFSFADEQAANERLVWKENEDENRGPPKKKKKKA